MLLRSSPDSWGPISKAEIDVLCNPSLQSAGGNEASVGVISSREPVKAVSERLFLHVGCELGDEKGVFDADVSSEKNIGDGLSQIQEFEALGDERGLFPCLCRYLLDSVLRVLPVKESAKPSGLFERMQIGPQEVFDHLNLLRLRVRIGMVYSTQSPSTINKELLAQTENFFVAHLSSQDEAKSLSRVQVAFAGAEQDILRAKTPGYMRMLTMSHRFVIPVQAKRFEAVAPVSEGAAGSVK
jgi:hypothetical protein